MSSGGRSARSARKACASGPAMPMFDSDRSPSPSTVTAYVKRNRKQSTGSVNPGQYCRRWSNSSSRVGGMPNCVGSASQTQAPPRPGPRALPLRIDLVGQAQLLGIGQHAQPGDRLLGQLDQLGAAVLVAQPGQRRRGFGAQAAMAEGQGLIQLADRRLIADQGQCVAQRDGQRHAARDPPARAPAANCPRPAATLPAGPATAPARPRGRSAAGCGWWRDAPARALRGSGNWPDRAPARPAADAPARRAAAERAPRSAMPLRRVWKQRRQRLHDRGHRPSAARR